MLSLGKSLARGLRSLVIPSACPACDRRVDRDGVLCALCRAGLTGLARASAELPVVPNLLAPLCYDGVVRTLIHRTKYSGERTAGLQLARWMRRAMRSSIGRGEPLILLPVPLHPVRRRERGFNQTERLARAVGTPLRLPVRADLLRRVRWVGPLASLDREERRKAVAAAFVCRRLPAGPVTWVLVDDVWTTGATLDACRAALREAGAEGTILQLVAARTPEHEPRLRN